MSGYAVLLNNELAKVKAERDALLASRAAGYERAHQRGTAAERERIRKLALEPSEEVLDYITDAILSSFKELTFVGLGSLTLNGKAGCHLARAVLRAFAEEIGR